MKKILKWTLSGKAERIYKRQVMAIGYEPGFRPNPNLKHPGRACGNALFGPSWIELNISPACPKDHARHIILHEMEHIVLDTEGYPGVEAKAGSEWVDCAEVLSILLDDPIINKRLHERGLGDRKEESRRLVRAGSPAWRLRDRSKPTTLAERLCQVFDYALTMLDLDDSVQEEYDRRFAAARQPDILEEGRSWLSFIEKHGFETPCQCLEILDKIFEHYDLPRSQIRIGDPRTGEEICLGP